MRSRLPPLLVLLLAFLLVAVACGTPSERPAPNAPPTPVSTVAPLVTSDPVTFQDASAMALSDAGGPPIMRFAFRGVNLSGAEFTGAGTRVPGVMGQDYQWPTPALADFWLDRGFNNFRVLFRWERMQPALRGPLADAELAPMRLLLDHVTRRGGTVTLTPHNSFRHGAGCDVLAKYDPKCHVVTAEEIEDFWGRLASELRGNSRTQIGITNEPHDMTTELVVALDNAAIREIRRVGFTGLVIAPGNGWDGAGSWGASWYGEPNANAMLRVVDQGANLAIEAHLYLDANADGKGAECVSVSVGIERLAVLTSWARAHGRGVVLGEIGAPNTPTCRDAVMRTLAFVEANFDVFISWAWWHSGIWSAATSPLSIGGLAGERPQLGWLLAFLPRSPACAGIVDGGRPSP